MTSNVKRHVQLPRSSQKGKKPTADDLKYGEIAVNFNVEEPFLAMKGSDDSILTMSFKDGKTGPWKKGEGEYSAVLDNGTPANPSDKVNTATGKYATAEGKGTTASGNKSHAEGVETKASGDASHAEGSLTTASNDDTHAEGSQTTASGNASHSEGSNTTASGSVSHAEGFRTTASGNNAHSEGDNTTAKGGSSHAEGNGTTADGENSHAEGNYTAASGDTSHAEGNYTTVNGTNSHGEGNHKIDLILAKDIVVGDTKIIIENRQMNIPNKDEYIKNCYITDNNDVYKILTISSYTGTLPANFRGIAREITVDKPLKKVSNNTTNNATFTSDIYSFVNVSVGEIDGGHSEGKNNIVIGEAGHAEGRFTISKGDFSHSEGFQTTASGKYSHTEGYATIASGKMSHSEGISTTASGEYSHVEGRNTTASESCSHAEGNSTNAGGKSSHAEGDSTNAAGIYSHTEGKGSIAVGDVTHVEGLHNRAMNFTDDVDAGSKELYIITTSEYPEDLEYYKNCLIKDNGQTVAIDVLNAELVPNSKFTNDSENKRIKLTLKEGVPKDSTRASQATENQRDGYYYTWDYALYNKGTIGNYGGHAEGSYTMVYEDSGHSEGKATIAKGKYSHSEGYHTIAGGETSHSEGLQTTASGPGSHAEGSNTTASGSVTHSEGSSTTASGEGSHAEGTGTTAEGDASHSEGNGTIAKGNYSHAEGDSTKAIGNYSHTEGHSTKANTTSSHAEGNGTTADGESSHAEGSNTIASGENSHAEGYHTMARGNNSHASGSYTIAENETQFVCGTYNKVYANQIFTIGIGIDNNSRKNALSINYDGSITSDVELTHGGTSMKGLSILGGIQASEGMIAPAYLNSSDERLKKNIETISDNDIDKVKNVELKSYAFKSDNSKHYGVIAQDVEKAGLTELVTNGADGMKSVDYISLLILKIAELENEIKNLKEQNKK